MIERATLAPPLATLVLAAPHTMHVGSMRPEGRSTGSGVCRKLPLNAFGKLREHEAIAHLA